MHLTAIAKTKVFTFTRVCQCIVHVYSIECKYLLKVKTMLSFYSLFSTNWAIRCIT